MSEQPAKNTDRELYREPKGDLPSDYYANSVHVTEDGRIGMSVGGTVTTLPIAEWHRHALAGLLPNSDAREEGVRQAIEWLRAGYEYGAGPEWRERGAEWIAERLVEERGERLPRKLTEVEQADLIKAAFNRPFNIPEPALRTGTKRVEYGFLDENGPHFSAHAYVGWGEQQAENERRAWGEGESRLIARVRTSFRDEFSDWSEVR